MLPEAGNRKQDCKEQDMGARGKSVPVNMNISRGTLAVLFTKYQYLF